MQIALAIVRVDSLRIGGEVCFYNVEGSVQDEIANAYTHAGLLHSVFTQGDAAVQGFFNESAIVLVAKEQARRGIAGNVDVRPPVIVKISGDDRQTVSCAGLFDAGFFAYLAERAVSVVAVERVRAILQTARSAKHLFRIATGELAATWHCLGIK